MKQYKTQTEIFYRMKNKIIFYIARPMLYVRLILNLKFRANRKWEQRCWELLWSSRESSWEWTRIPFVFLHCFILRIILRDSECASFIEGEKTKGNIYSVDRNSIKKRIDNYLEVRKPIFKSIPCLRRITWCSVKVGSIIKATFTLHQFLSSPGQCGSIWVRKVRQKGVTIWTKSLCSLSQTLPYRTKPKIKFELRL